MYRIVAGVGLVLVASACIAVAGMSFTGVPAPTDPSTGFIPLRSWVLGLCGLIMLVVGMVFLGGRYDAESAESGPSH